MAEETTTPDVPEIDQKAWKNALLGSVGCYIPKEMGRTVFVKAGSMRTTFGDAVARSKCGVTKDHRHDDLVPLTVETIYGLCKGV